MQKWEYTERRTAVNTDNPHIHWNKLGEEGWELVAIHRFGRSEQVIGFFKRPLN